MFFIGIFGLDSKIKEIGSANNIVCPSCKAITHLEIFKVYNFLHIFFIPTFRWNVKYIAKPPCCGAVYAIDDILGKAFERGKNPTVYPENLKIIENGKVFARCNHCSREIGQGFYYCPYCGEKL